MRRTLVTVLHNPRPSDVDNVNFILRQTTHDAAIIVDHSQTPTTGLLVEPHWRGGANGGYGGGINYAANEIREGALVYFSSNRSVMHDSNWIDDITAPLTNPRCGIAGTVAPCSFDRIARRPDDIFEPQIHVQGGCWAAMAEVICECPVSPYFPQVFSDVYLSWAILKSGRKLVDVPTISAVAGGAARTGAKLTVGYDAEDRLDTVYHQLSGCKSPIYQHLPTLRKYAAQANRVAEFGVEFGNSTIALLAGRPRWMRSYDCQPAQIKEMPQVSTDWKFILQDDSEVDLPVVDLLFIDTDHTYDVLDRELRQHAGKVTRWIILHDTTTFPDMRRAMVDFLSRQDQFRVEREWTNNNGLTVLERVRGYPVCPPSS